MVFFSKETLESYKYADLVKVAKEHDVYRRYAPKAELIEKLVALSGSSVETLNDVSMPSFMENDDTESDELDQEITVPAMKNCAKRSRASSGMRTKAEDKNGGPLSSRAPFAVKVPHVNIVTSDQLKSPLNVLNTSGTSQVVRRSLAGPVKNKVSRLKVKCQTSSETERKTKNANASSETVTRRITRRQACDVENVDVVKENNGQRFKREGTFDIDQNKKQKKKGQIREGTFDVEHTRTDDVSHSGVKDTIPSPHKIRREGTFEVKGKTVDASYIPSSLPRSKRESTFKLEKTSMFSTHVTVSQSKPTPLRTPRASSIRFSQIKSPASSLQSKRNSVATPSSVRPLEKIAFGKSDPQQLITSCGKAGSLISPRCRSSTSKSKIPSLMNEIKAKKAKVSAKKLAEAPGGKQNILSKKPPDFNSIHQRLFDKMESLVDSRQKIITKMQKYHHGPRSPPKVVRKLLSPKVGKSKLTSPKPVFQHMASVFTSKVVSIPKKPTFGSTIEGVSQLKSPQQILEAKTKALSGKARRFDEQSRKDAYKTAVMGRKPIKKNSPLTKAKQALSTVRLNKRFELQMKHRLAQQTSNF